eukprot:TRINITY_DN736_c0_g2_i1.p1 TRINITY_DN736_c0_g2~~TRINITY_DN736_c0_g2_i1.p1  ORF type:complete len:266 (+),score=32.63 TRINITY_DN736_c0_g2_i1:71-868(+)
MNSLDTIFEKHEYPNGPVQFVPAQQFVPGRAYYTQQVDPSNQVFYIERTNPYATMQPPPQFVSMHSPPQFVTMSPPARPAPVATTPGYSVAPSDPSAGPTNPVPAQDIDAANALHLGITITSIFIPTLIYIIAFPFMHLRATNLLRQMGNVPFEAKTKLNAFLGVGWTSWVFHLGLFISLLTFWIGGYCTPGSYHSYSYYDYTNGIYYPGYSYYSSSYCYYPGLPAPITFGVLVFVFNIVTLAVGADFIQCVRNLNSPYQTVSLN